MCRPQRRRARYPTMQFKGDVQVADLHTIAGPANDDLVKWRNLAVTGIDLSHNPDRLTIERIVARQPYARVIIRQDQTLNVAAALKRDSSDTTEHEPAASDAVQTDAGAHQDRHADRWLGVVRGLLDHAFVRDRHRRSRRHDHRPLVAAGFAREGAAGGQGRSLRAGRHHGRSEPARRGEVHRPRAELPQHGADDVQSVLGQVRRLQHQQGQAVDRAAATRSRIASSTRSITSWSTTWSSATRPIRRMRRRFRSSSRSRCSRTGKA